MGALDITYSILNPNPDCGLMGKLPIREWLFGSGIAYAVSFVMTLIFPHEKLIMETNSPSYQYTPVTHFDNQLLFMKKTKKNSFIIEQKKFEKAKLLLLANRYDPNSVIYSVPLDVAKIVAKLCIEIELLDKENDIKDMFKEVLVGIKLAEVEEKVNINYKFIHFTVSPNFLYLPFYSLSKFALHN